MGWLAPAALKVLLAKDTACETSPFAGGCEMLAHRSKET
jgi:hypothetical protein